MSERKLAHIETIEWLQPIEGKDRIVLAGVLGWTVIVQKSDFNVGDKVVFCEIDSVFPNDRPEFAFLEKKNYRIRTMKMAGVLSQGICFPLSILPEGNYEVGDDVTELMGITQYEQTMDKEERPPKEVIPKKTYPRWLMRIPFMRKLLARNKKEQKGFPSFVSKTDETRIQNAPHYLKMDMKWVATEKVDGQSGTFTLERLKKKFPWSKQKFDFAVCSRNLRKYEPDDSTFWFVAKKYGIESILHNLIGDHQWIAIQGECIGPGVQGNKYKATYPDLYCFNLIYPTGRVGSLRARDILEEQGLKFVPILDNAADIKGMTVPEVLDYATGTSQLYDTLREGIVFRSFDGKQSFKAVSPEFLIKHGE